MSKTDLKLYSADEVESARTKGQVIALDPDQHRWHADRDRGREAALEMMLRPM
jgi:hypothetical protein